MRQTRKITAITRTFVFFKILLMFVLISSISNVIQADESDDINKPLIKVITLIEQSATVVHAEFTTQMQPQQMRYQLYGLPIGIIPESIMITPIDEKRKGLWIGMYYDRDIFFFDTTSNTLKQVDFGDNVLRNCARSGARIQLIGNDIFFHGPQCIAKQTAKGKTWQLISKTAKLYKGNLFRVTTGEPLWFTTRRSLYSVTENNVVRHRSPWQETSERVKDLLKMGNTLWASGSAINILDIENNVWKKVSDIAANKLRIINNKVVAITYQKLYTIDPSTFAVTELNLGKRRWQSLNNLAFDGTNWWAVGGKGNRDSTGLRAWDGEKEQRWTRVEGMPFREAKQVILDPDQTDTI